MVDIRVGGKDYGSGIKELDFADLDGELDESGTRLTASGGGGGGASSVWLPLGSFYGVAGWGYVGAGTGDRRAAWLFDPAVNEYIGLDVPADAIPDDWTACDIIVEGAPKATTGAGSDVTWTAYQKSVAAGDSFASASATGVVTRTLSSGAANIKSRFTVASNVAITAGKSLSIQIRRLADEVTDTFDQDFGVTAVVLQKYPS